MVNASKSFRSITTSAAAAVVAIITAGSASTLASTTPNPEPFAWPASLTPFGDGYPNAGDACRRLGESPATSPYLDHMATLVGCPGGGDSPSVRAMLRDQRGHVVGEAEGVTLISVPTDGTMRKAAASGMKKHAQVKKRQCRHIPASR